jgi:endonuclease/exonuclease/phosphatase family metal-dependent hydrolase
MTGRIIRILSLGLCFTLWFVMTTALSPSLPPVPQLPSIENVKGFNAETVRGLLEVYYGRQVSAEEVGALGRAAQKAFGDENAGRTPSTEPNLDIWKSLISVATRQDLYATANAALDQLKVARQRAKFPILQNLVIIRSEILENRYGSPATLNFILAQPPINNNDNNLMSNLPALHKRDSESGHRWEGHRVNRLVRSVSDFNEAPSLLLPEGIDNDKRSSSVRYVPPLVSASSREVDLSYDPSAVEFAKQYIVSRAGEALNLKLIKITEETVTVDPPMHDTYLVAVIELDTQAASLNKYMLLTYNPQKNSNTAMSHNYLHFTFTETVSGEKYEISLLANSYGGSETAKMRKNYNGHEINENKNNNQNKMYSITKYTSSRKISRAERAFVGTTKGTTIISYNIWNWNGDWPVRKQLIADVVKENHPDVVGFQEIRTRLGSGTNQLEELAALLPGYHYVYQPAMYYRDDAEGVGILTKYPILSTQYINLTHVPGTADANKRVVLKTLLDTPFGLFNFFATHFSYAKGLGQMSNAMELLNWMHQQEPGPAPQVVVGDFNIYTDFLRPVDFLTGKTSYLGKTGDLRDIWETLYPDDNGYTFSNLPGSSGLINRADRILIRAHTDKLKEVNATRAGIYQPGSIPASDHLAVVCTFAARSD